MKRIKIVVFIILMALSTTACQSISGVDSPSSEPVIMSNSEETGSSSGLSISNPAIDDVSSENTSDTEEFTHSVPSSSANTLSSAPVSYKEASSASSKSESSKPEEKFQGKAIFKDEIVLALYSLDYGNRLYHPVNDLKSAADIFSALEEIDADALTMGKDRVGFLVFTEKSKYAYYFDTASQDDSQADLIKASKDYNKSSTGIAQWLAYMSISNISNVYFSGECGPSYSLRNWSDKKSFGIEVDTNNADTINIVGKFLKNMTVYGTPAIQASNGDINMQTNNGNVFSIKLDFNTGTKYHIIGELDTVTIYSSDMAEAITYKCSLDTIKSLRDCMAGLKTAKKGPGIFG